MSDFDRKVEEASARVNQTVAEVVDRLEKETADMVRYLNDEVVPAVRAHSSTGLRVASQKLQELADYLEKANKPRS
jgi:hypothetical protein